ncbi:ABC transporter substrate-binding protein [Rathayibacter sp. VKM Ac-2754]|uniref:ABC transporter substrate-binding protein n=1 Tax=Rathayibacter sp. VKM Ac-2754 TaxID=2609251 RepID=UPI001359523F|nr:ABC transporter substrate-binding protein [Rathayibacter sp. VKM Ac-2754]MWV58936.1 hypothetical protein [Rathayibacter sp. VKM Ac-2754]
MPNPTKIRPRAAVHAATAVVGLTALLALTACSGGASAGPAASADCETTTPAHLLIGTGDLDVSYIPYGILANELGYFADECVDMTIDAAADGGLQSLLNGQVDFSMSAPSEALLSGGGAAMGGKIVYNLIPDLNISLAVSADSELDSAEDLAGKTIGVSEVGGYYDAYMNRTLGAFGLGLDDVTLITTGYGSTPMQALESGEVDAVLYWPGIYASWELAGSDLRILEGTEWTADLDGIGLMTRDDVVTDQPELVESVSRALAKSAVYLKQYPESAVRLFWDAYPERAPLPGADEEEAMTKDLAILAATTGPMGIDDREADYTWGVQTPERWENAVEFFTEGGLLPADSDVTVSDFFSSDHIDAANDFDHDAIAEQ